MIMQIFTYICLKGCHQIEGDLLSLFYNKLLSDFKYKLKNLNFIYKNSLFDYKIIFSTTLKIGIQFGEENKIRNCQNFESTV